jgi:sirohydrochlorin cobaltochelatase
MALEGKRRTFNAQHSTFKRALIRRWTFGVERSTFACSVMTKRPNDALLIVGHGSTIDADSSAPSKKHAAEIRRRRLFADVHCCFWKEEPSMRDALLIFDPEEIQNVYVVPNFISEGYFTNTVIPRELELTDAVTTRSSGQTWKYCDPVGNHPAVTELLLQRAREVAPGVPESETTLFIVGHGTALNDNSAVAAKREAENIRALHRYAAVVNAYMEEPPLISDWPKLSATRSVVVVPFFIADGLHSYGDIPVLLGIDNKTRPRDSAEETIGVFRRNPHELHGHSLYYGSAIGTAARFADLIVEQVAKFDQVHASMQLVS